MARALIVGCGCRGRLLGQRLQAEGWTARGTSRSTEGLEEIAAAGIEPALADPNRPGTVLDLVGDVAVVYWLLGSARGGQEAVEPLHGSSLEQVLERLVETPVRGFAYEAAGSVDRAHRERGEALVRAAGERWRIPVEILAADPAETAGWVAEALAAAQRLTSERPASPEMRGA